MLYVIKQYISLFNSLLVSNLSNFERATLSQADVNDGEKDGKFNLSKLKELDENFAKKIQEILNINTDKASFSIEGAVNLLKKHNIEIKEIKKNHLYDKIDITIKTSNELTNHQLDGLKNDTKENIDVSIFKRTLKKGSRGEDVKVLQRFLKIEDDGAFGNGTKRALQAFQRSIGYNNPDGVLTISKNKEYDTFKAIKKQLQETKSVKEEQQQIVKEVKETTQTTKTVEKKYYKNTENTKIKLEKRETEYDKEKLEDLDSYNFEDFMVKLGKDLKRGDILLKYETETEFEATDYILNNYNNIREDEDGTKYYVEEKEFTINKNNIKENLGDEDKINALLKKYGYEDERGFFVKLFSGRDNEKDFLSTRFDNIDKIDITNVNSVKEFLFDMDFNGHIDSELDSFASEASINDNFRTIGQIKNLLENIGMPTDLSNLKSDIAFREKFKNRFKTILAMKVPFTVLGVKDGYKKFVEQELKVESEYQNKIDKILNSPATSQIIKDRLTKAGIENNKANILAVKEYTIGVAFGYIKGAGVNINIEELTNGIVDGISIGGFRKDGKNGFNIGLNKRILEAKFARTSVDVDALLSFSGIGLHLGVGQELDDQVSGDTIVVGLGAGAGIGFNGEGYSNLDASISSLTTSNMEGFNRIMTIESKNMDKFISLIKNDKEFTDKQIKDMYAGDLSDEDISRVKDNFKDLKAKYEVAVLATEINDKESLKTLDAKFKKAVLTAMATNLYKQVNGLRLTGIGAFIIPGVLTGIYPLIEYNWTKHKSHSSDMVNDISKNITSVDVRESIKRNELEKYINIHDNNIVIDRSKVNTEFKHQEGMTITKADDSDSHVEVVADKGYKLNINLVQSYKYDDNKNESYKVLDLVVEAVKSKNNEISGTMIEIPKSLQKDIDTLGTGFDAKTRYKKGAVEVIRPTNSLDQKWDGLIRLNKSIKDINLTNLINSNPDDKIKAFILTKVSQLISKSNDFNNGDLSKWDNNEYIKTDEKRSKSFDRLIKKGLGGDISKERTAYYEALKGKGKIGESTINGIGFDMKSTLLWDKKGKAYAIRGAEAQAGNISVLSKDGKEIFIPITDKTFITNFVNKLTPTQLRLAGISNTTEGKQQLVDSITSGDKTLGYAKDPYGFDDLIILKTNAKAADDVLSGTASKTADYISTDFKSLGFIAGITERIEDDRMITSNVEFNQSDSEPIDDKPIKIN